MCAKRLPGPRKRKNKRRWIDPFGLFAKKDVKKTSKPEKDSAAEEDEEGHIVIAEEPRPGEKKSWFDTIGLFVKKKKRAKENTLKKKFLG